MYLRLRNPHLFVPGPRRLPPNASLFCHAAGCAWVALLVVVACLPQTFPVLPLTNFNYAPVAIGALAAWVFGAWFWPLGGPRPLAGRTWFTGPQPPQEQDRSVTRRMCRLSELLASAERGLFSSAERGLLWGGGDPSVSPRDGLRTVDDDAAEILTDCGDPLKV